MSWAAENLTPERRQEIAEGLIGQGGGRVTQHVAGRGELVALCPLHQESNPSFSYNYTKDVYNCSSGCGGGDLIELYCQVNGLSAKDGFLAFKRAYGAPDSPAGRQPGKPAAPSRAGFAGRNRSRGPGNGPSGPKIIPEADWERLPPLPGDYIERLVAERKWNRETIKRLELRLDHSTPPRVAIPIRDGGGRLVNVRRYLPPWLRPKTGDKPGKVISWGRGYGSGRLFPDAAFWASGPVILCEGEPDVICGLSHGLNCCTQTAGAGSFPAHLAPAFQGREVIIAYDADDAGRKGAKKAARILAPVVAQVKIIEWPEWMWATGDQAGEAA